MEFGFITWWFEKHFIWSTLLTPGMTLAWCFYKELLWRGIVAGFLTAAFIGKMGPCKGWTRAKSGKEGCGESIGE
jgi:hypothetical protein